MIALLQGLKPGEAVARRLPCGATIRVERFDRRGALAPEAIGYEITIRDKSEFAVGDEDRNAELPYLDNLHCVRIAVLDSSIEAIREIFNSLGEISEVNQ